MHKHQGVPWHLEERPSQRRVHRQLGRLVDRTAITGDGARLPAGRLHRAPRAVGSSTPASGAVRGPRAARRLSGARASWTTSRPSRTQMQAPSRDHPARVADRPRRRQRGRDRRDAAALLRQDHHRGRADRARAGRAGGQRVSGEQPGDLLLGPRRDAGRPRHGLQVADVRPDRPRPADRLGQPRRSGRYATRSGRRPDLADGCRPDGARGGRHRHPHLFRGALAAART